MLSLSDSSPDTLSVSDALSVFSLSSSSMGTLGLCLVFWAFFLDSVTAGLRFFAFRLAFSAFYRKGKKYMYLQCTTMYIVVKTYQKHVYL